MNATSFMLSLFLLLPFACSFVTFSKYSSHLLRSSSLSSSNINSGATSTQMKSSKDGDIAVVGCGVLGTSLCKQLLSSPDFQGRKGKTNFCSFFSILIHYFIYSFIIKLLSFLYSMLQ